MAPCPLSTGRDRGGEGGRGERGERDRGVSGKREKREGKKRKKGRNPGEEVTRIKINHAGW